MPDSNYTEARCGMIKYERNYLSGVIQRTIQSTAPIVVLMLFIAFIPFEFFYAANGDACQGVTFGIGGPDRVVEGRPYSWQVPVMRGFPPYRFTCSGDLPWGLSFDNSKGIISGIAGRYMNQSVYRPTIAVFDSSGGLGCQRSYDFNVVYASNIGISTSNFDIETRISISGTPTDNKLKISLLM